MITPSYGLTATERVLPRLTLDWTSGSAQPGVDVTRAGVATFVGSNGLIQDATADTQRIDYSTGIPGLLVEETRTNIILQSEFVSGWSFNAAGSFATTTTAPDGGIAQVLADNSAVASGQVFQSVPFVSGTVYSFSFYVKAVNRTTGLAQSFTQLGSFTFDLTGSGSVGVPSGVFTNPTIKAVGSGWFRITANLTATATANGNLGFSTNSSVFVGNAFALWGAQLEVGATVSSYIPTEATTVTRNTDVATMTGTDFSDWYSAGAGSVVVRVLPSTVSGTRPALQFDDTTANEVITLRGETTNPELVIVDGGSPQAQIDAGTIAANTAYNLGAAWDTDNCAAAVNGGAAVTDTTATIPTVTQARLGSDGTNYLNGHLQTVRYWPQRLTDAEIQAFSK